MEVDSIELKPNAAAAAAAASTSSSSSASLPDSSTNAANNNNLRGASKFLLNLPSRGLFSSTVPSSNPGGLRIYVCEHETSPPEEQIITTNQQNILIRSLTLKKQKNDSSLKDGKSKAATETAKGKRAAERVIEGRAKRAATASRNSQQEGSSSRPAEKGFPFQSLTVEKLRGLLKQRGLPTRGKKDELISRLRKDDNVDGEA